MKRCLLRASASALLIFLALYGGVFSLIGTFSLTADTRFVLLLCLGSAILCALLFALPSARARIPAVLLVLVILLALVWLNFDRCLLGAKVVFHEISHRYHQIAPDILYYVLPDGLTLSVMQEAAAWFYGLCIPLLGLWFGLWFGHMKVFLPGLLLALAMPAVGLAVFLEPPILPALALVLLIGLVLLCRASLWRQPAQGARRVWTAVIPLALVMALVLALFPPSEYVRGQLPEQLRVEAAQLGDRLGLLWGSPQSGTPMGVSASNGAQNFSQAGPLRFTGRVDLTVEGLPAGVHLLRGFSAGVYGETGWEPLNASAYTVTFPDEFHPLNFPALALRTQHPDRQPASVTVTRVDGTSNYLFTPGLLASSPADIPDAVFTHDAYLALSGQGSSRQFEVFPLPSVPNGSLTDDAAYWEGRYRAWVYNHYLDIPEERFTEDALKVIYALSGDGKHVSLEDATQLWSSLGLPVFSLSDSSVSPYNSAQIRSPVALAEGVKLYLASIADYDQDTPQAPDGAEFISYFLTEGRRGYCLHFASAAVMMLRAMGCPARFVSGYAIEVQSGETRVDVRDYHAHAWVEVYVDGYGWFPVDVTPARSGAQQERPDRPAASQSPSPTPSTQTTPTPTPAPSMGPAPSNRPQAAVTGPQSSPIPWGPILIPIGSLLAFLLLLWGQRRLRLGRWTRAMTQEDPNRGTIAAYRYLTRLARRGHVPLDEYALALAQKAAFSQHTISPEERAALAAIVASAQADAKAKNGLTGRLLLRWLWALL